jgi:hypothetical protein
MELAGNEKKIQALFRELKLADERLAPEFIKVWNRAQATSPRLSPGFKISFVVATALVVITLCSVVLWSRRWQRRQLPGPGVAGRSVKPGSMPVPPPAMPSTTSGPTQRVVAQSHNRVKSNRWDRKVAARRHADVSARNAVIREAVAISTWQSPTAALMQSAADDVLTSLPQLDRSLTELKSFLPNTPSNQNRER